MQNNNLSIQLGASPELIIKEVSQIQRQSPVFISRHVRLKLQKKVEGKFGEQDKSFKFVDIE